MDKVQRNSPQMMIIMILELQIIDIIYSPWAGDDVYLRTLLAVGVARHGIYGHVQ